MKEPALIREITLSGFTGDSNMLDPANWPGSSESAGGATVPGYLEVQPNASGWEFWILLVDGSGDEITPQGTFAYRIVERYNEADSKAASQARTMASATYTGKTVGLVHEHVSDSAGRPQGTRKVTVEVTTAFTSLPGAGETKAQVWARSR